ncbi:MAG: DMT family transporter [Gallionella sp.]
MYSVVKHNFASPKTIGIAFAFIAAIGFSTKAIMVKLAYVEGVDAITLLALRMAFSVPFFLAVAFHSSTNTSSVSLTNKDKSVVVALGLIGYYLASYLDFMGLQFISAGLERLILFLYPTMVVIISTLIYKNRVGRTVLLALFISYAGIALVFLHDMRVLQHDALLGSILVFASALAYAIYLVGAGQIISKIGATRFTAYAMTVACVACLFQFVVTHTLVDLQLSPRVYGLSVAMAIFSTVLPAFLLAEAMKRIGSSYTAMVGSAGPVSTIYLAYIFLGEQLSVVQVCGSILVLVGVLMIGLRK